MALAQFPENAKFYITKNFYNDVYGNPRKFYEIYDQEMNYLGYCQDNYAGENFCGGRNLKRIDYILIKGGFRDYKKRIKNDTEFKNQSK